MPGNEARTVTTARVKEPRTLGNKETRENLDHWFDQFRSYWKRDDRYRVFLAEATTWNPAEPYGGFEDEGQASLLKRPKEEKYQDLIDFLDNLAGHLPFRYLTGKLKKSTKSFRDVQEAVFEIYGVQNTASTLLDFAKMKKNSDETYRQFFERMENHVVSHMTVPGGEGLSIKGITINPEGESVTIALLNQITIAWMQAIDSNLVGLVQTAYSKDLKRKNTQIYDLMPDIAENVDELLSRNESLVQRVSEHMEELTVRRFRNSQSRGRGRGRGVSKQFGGDKSGHNSQQECLKCVTLQAEAGAGAKFKTNHHPSDCPNKRLYVRLMGEEKVDNEEEHEEKFSDFEEDEGDDGKPPDILKMNSKLLFKVTEVRREPSAASEHRHQNKQADFISQSNVENISENPDIAKIQKVVTRLNSHLDTPDRALSPTFEGEFNGKPLIVVADSGAELNCLDRAVADRLGVKYGPTHTKASGVGENSVVIRGQTLKDFIITTDFNGTDIKIDFGKTPVVDNLGTDALLGEPGLGLNQMETKATNSEIQVTRNDQIYKKKYLSGKKKNYQVCRVNQRTVLYPGEVLEWPIPDTLPLDGVFILTPQRGQTEWYRPGVCTSRDGKLRITNISTEIVSIPKTQHIGELRQCLQEKVDKPPAVRKLEQLPSCQFKYELFGDERKTVKEPEIELDPDGIMNAADKKIFRQITNDYADIFNKQPGKYNGAYGRVNNTLNFATRPPPNKKVYLPQYSEEMRRIQGDLMDQLYSYGVLRTPEEIGVSVEVVSPSLLVAKSTPGEFRLVTDFGVINNHIRKCPAVSPCIAEAKQMLARARYFIHLDLANYFFQSGMTREDCQFLGTVHPYKGTMVYVVEPQGLKNASEHGYEVLARVYGDLCQVGKMTRMADSVFVLADTFEDLQVNYREVLRRARVSNLTFKPGKVIICPQRTVLFGWELSGTEWKPTSHTTSALARAPLPTTVKGLRSFLGSYKQFTECVSEYAKLLHPLDLLAAGRASNEKLTWTEDNIKIFEAAKASTNDIRGVHIPRPDDTLTTYSDYSEEHHAIGGRLEISRVIDGKTVKLHGGYISQILDKLKSKWLPCEGEALGIRLVLENFSHFIRENLNNTIHYTDNSPCVQAYKRSLTGAFSNSARISQFLTGLSALPVEIRHKAGITMYSSDFISRNPTVCSVPDSCQICKFARRLQAEGENTKKLRNVTVKDIMSGHVLMPFCQRRAWLSSQLSDSVHAQLVKLIRTAQLPNKKKTRGDATKVKQLHTLYTKNELKIDRDGLVMVKNPNGHFDGWVISVPHLLLPGLASALHIKLEHPSRAQLTSLMSRYFYCPGHTALIHEVSDSCVLCRSLKPLPKSLLENTTQKVESVGSEFAVDVLQRNSQNILLMREKLSQYTWLRIIPDQRAETLKSILTQTLLPWVNPAGAVLRTDGAKSFVSLSESSKHEDSIFHKHKITIDIGRTHNRNKNPVAENAIGECEKEIKKHKPHIHILSDEDLSEIQKTMNERIRNRGLAAKEILTRRDLLSNVPKDVQDHVLAEDQFDKRLSTVDRDRKRNPVSHSHNFHIGDLVYLKDQLTKHTPRPTFIIVAFRRDQVEIQKLHTQFRQQKYKVYPEELISATGNSDELFTKTKEIQANNEKTFNALETRDKEKMPTESRFKESNLARDKEKKPISGAKAGDKEKMPKESCKQPAPVITVRPQLRPRREAARKAAEAWRPIMKVTSEASDWRLPKSGFTTDTKVDEEDDFYWITVATEQPGLQHIGQAVNVPAEFVDEQEVIDHQPDLEDAQRVDDAENSDQFETPPELDTTGDVSLIEDEYDHEVEILPPVLPQLGAVRQPSAPDQVALGQIATVQNFEAVLDSLQPTVQSLTDNQPSQTVQSRPRRSQQVENYNVYHKTGFKGQQK